MSVRDGVIGGPERSAYRDAVVGRQRDRDPVLGATASNFSISSFVGESASRLVWPLARTYRRSAATFTLGEGRKLKSVVGMGKRFPELDDDLRAFIARQHMFFVATAPLTVGGHVNVSPKGLDTFRVLGPTTVAYLDLTGSGVETIAHPRENGRITVMFCAFEGRPRILRLYGRGRSVEPGGAEWSTTSAGFPARSGVRAVIRIEVERIADSCGYAVPLYEFVGERDQLLAWADAKGEEELRRYRAQKNRTSVDGLPGLPSVDQ